MAATETTIQVVYLSVPASCLQSGTLDVLPLDAQQSRLSVVATLISTIGEAPNKASTVVL
jgi:hypothetical protein